MAIRHLAGALAPVFLVSGADACCGNRPFPQSFELSSTSSDSRYGIFLAAPLEAGCDGVRYRVVDGSARVLAYGMLASGSGAVIRLGGGFAPGRHDLTILVQGCTEQALHARRVKLSRASPDHSWRGH